MLGLHLLHLLVAARLADLHCEVESLTAEDRASPFIAFPLRLETYLMEGSYNKVRQWGWRRRRLVALCAFSNTKWGRLSFFCHWSWLNAHPPSRPATDPRGAV